MEEGGNNAAIKQNEARNLLLAGFIVAILLSSVIIATSANKDTVYLPTLQTKKPTYNINKFPR